MATSAASAGAKRIVARRSSNSTPGVSSACSFLVRTVAPRATQSFPALGNNTGDSSRKYTARVGCRTQCSHSETELLASLCVHPVRGMHRGTDPAGIQAFRGRRLFDADGGDFVGAAVAAACA